MVLHVRNFTCKDNEGTYRSEADMQMSWMKGEKVEEAHVIDTYGKSSAEVLRENKKAA